MTRLSKCLAGLLVVAATACELEELTVVQTDDVVVAEVYVLLGSAAGGGNRVIAFLHRTIDEGAAVRDVPGARVSIGLPSGVTLQLTPVEASTCLTSVEEGRPGSCYWASPEALTALEPGQRLALTIDLPSGEVMRSATTVPSDFSIDGIGDGARCSLPPETSMELRWNSSPGTWAYVNETSIVGLRAALAPRGISVDDDEDPLYLLGLSVSATDTTIVFPSEFGVFDRFGLDQGIALTLQKGLPENTSASVTISATDRNYVNWARGGNFNPSGAVRVPSIRGDGTGVFASAVVRGFEVVVAPGTSTDPVVTACQTG